MSDTSLVSVIIPFFNAPTIQNAIESILSQTYQNFELILVDNNSSDDSLKIAQEYANHVKISLANEPRQGVVFAMDKGIGISKGSFIMRMDADDVSFPDRIEKQLNTFRERPGLSVVSGLVIYEGADENKGFRVYVDWLNSILSSEQIRLNQFVEFPMANPSLMFRKEVFEKYGMFEEGDFPEDYEFFLRLQMNGVKMGKVNHSVLKWIDSESRFTRTDPRYSAEAFFKIKATYLAQWLQRNNAHYPKVLIWGAGRLSRKRSSYLSNYGIEIEGYIDVTKKTDIIHYENIPSKESCFIVSYVSNRGARDEIRSFLVSRGFDEGIQFILAS